MSRSPWREALDGQIKVLRELRRQTAFVHLAKSGRIPEIEREFKGRPDFPNFLLQFGATTADGIAALVREAEPIHIENDIQNEVMRRLDRMRRAKELEVLPSYVRTILEQPLTPAMLPIPKGLIWFSESGGLSMDDVKTRPEWTETGKVVLRAVYFGEDFEARVRRDRTVELGYHIETFSDAEVGLGCIVFLDARRSGFVNTVGEFGDHLVPVPLAPWTFGQGLTSVVPQSNAVARSRNVDAQGAAILTINTYTYLAVLFRMMLERITRWGGVALNRVEAEQAQREKLRPRVQLVTWRKANYQYPEGHIPVPKNWSCRWSVRPHYRRYKSGKVVEIKSYIKGPSDKPYRPPVIRAHDIRY